MTGENATREEYLSRLLSVYRVVSVLSEKNGCRTLRLRHRELGRDLVLHLLPFRSPVYETLRSLRCENLPEVYDAVPLSDGEAVLEEYVDGVTVAAVTEAGSTATARRGRSLPASAPLFPCCTRAGWCTGTSNRRT